MSNNVLRLFGGFIAILALAPVAMAQTAPAAQGGGRQRGGAAAGAQAAPGAASNGKEIEGAGGQMPHYTYPAAPGPAPRQEVSGTWGGPLSTPKIDPVPPMTAWGKERFAANKSNQRINVASSNDPLNHCDPLGFPRNALWESRGIAFATMPGKIAELFQYQRTWREIFTDGRELPKDVGGNGPDSRYYGYSVGHWDGDYTLVVDTVGLDDGTWLDNAGHPHSGDLRVNERYTRVDQHTLEMTVVLDDPKTYTAKWMAGKTTFKWIPQQEFDEQLCIPSQMEDYLKVLAGPAGAPSGGH